ncbi:MAG: UDP-N-acetylglucosamine 2-epimerase (non-hydrolyzing) [Eubacteriales bacterium]
MKKDRKKILVVFGTRPEAIKMSPLVHELKKRDAIDVKVCVTGQHREMLDQVLEAFGITPDFDFSIMKKNQDLFDITIEVMKKMKELLMDLQPDLVLVHGDTTTAFISAYSAFYLKIPVGHVEAGLRTNNIYSPFPEEINRQSIGLVASYNFAPTQTAKENLLNEGKDQSKIFVTGNTVIDALKHTVRSDYSHELLDWVGDDKLILITAHRRENIGNAMENMFSAINDVVNSNKNVKAIYPIHLNPKVRELANTIFKGNERIKLVEPLDVLDFHNFMGKSYLILTDSGGIQEEASSLGKPVLVMRDTTERPEGIKAGTLRLVGTSRELIYESCCQLLEDIDAYESMSKASNPYGDGSASKKIADIIQNI